MNKNRINKCIEMMEFVRDNAYKLSMCHWQGTKKDEPCLGWNYIPKKTLSKIHACGNTACFAGYLAVQPWFKKAGGKSSESGAPEYKECHGEVAVSEFLDISYEIAKALCAMDHDYDEEEGLRKSRWYNKKIKNIKPQDVINSLICLRDNGKLVRRGYEVE